jgi:hypothetical protein
MSKQQNGRGLVDWKAGERSRIVVPHRAAAVSEEDRVVHFVGSTESVDRYRTKLVGWVTDQFRKNPVFLLQHSSWDWPIGRALRVGLNKKKELAFDIQYVPGDLIPYAETAYRMVVGKWMRACSVGFIPGTVEWDDRDRIHILRDNELLELSQVSVPGNPEALAKLSAAVPERERGLLLGNGRWTDDGAMTRAQALERVLEWAETAPVPALPEERSGDDLCTLVEWQAEESRAAGGRRYVVLSAGELGADGHETEPAAKEPAGRAEKIKVETTHGSEPIGVTALKEAAARGGVTYEDLVASMRAAEADLEAYAEGQAAAPEASLTEAAARGGIFMRGMQLAFAQYGVELELPEPLTVEAVERAWGAALAGLADDGAEERAGAVLNRANRQRLRAIRNLASQVLDSAGDAEDEETAPEEEPGDRSAEPATATRRREINPERASEYLGADRGAIARLERLAGLAERSIVVQITPDGSVTLWWEEPVDESAAGTGMVETELAAPIDTTVVDQKPEERVAAAAERAARRAVQATDDRVTRALAKIEETEAKRLGRQLVVERKQSRYDAILEKTETAVKKLEGRSAAGRKVRRVP